MNARHITTTGKETEITLNDMLFAVPVNRDLLSQAVSVYRSNQRQGTSKVKTRAEVNLTKKKWFKQKGTGNARHGAQSAPLFVGGGVAHGPKGIENWNRDFSKKMKRQAMISALSAQSSRIVVHDQLELLEGKTTQAAQMLSSISKDSKRILVVLPEAMPVVERSLRNLEGVELTTAAQLSLLDVAQASRLVFTSKAIEALEARLGITPQEAVKPARKPRSTKPKKTETTE